MLSSDFWAGMWCQIDDKLNVEKTDIPHDDVSAIYVKVVAKVI